MGLVKIKHCGQMSHGSYESIQYRIREKLLLMTDNKSWDDDLFNIYLLFAIGNEVYLDQDQLRTLQEYGVIEIAL